MTGLRQELEESLPRFLEEREADVKPETAIEVEPSNVVEPQEEQEEDL